MHRPRPRGTAPPNKEGALLHEFLQKNRSELVARCQEKVAQRPAGRPGDRGLRYGIPLFLDQLVEVLRLEHANAGTISSALPEAPATMIHAAPSPSDIGKTAAQHGSELLRTGFTVDQVVHDYGDLCQSITEMAVEQDAAVTPDEFRILNRCLDDAIADAVTEFERQRDQLMADDTSRATNERLGFVAHELRNLVQTAILSMAAIKKGDVGLSGGNGRGA
jgi:hypothetical protein